MAEVFLLNYAIINHNGQTVDDYSNVTDALEGVYGQLDSQNLNDLYHGLISDEAIYNGLSDNCYWAGYHIAQSRVQQGKKLDKEIVQKVFYAFDGDCNDPDDWHNERLICGNDVISCGLLESRLQGVTVKPDED